MNICSKLLLVFITLALITVTTLSLFAIDNAIKIIKQENEDTLNNRVDEKVNLIRNYFKEKQQSTILLAALPFISNEMENQLATIAQGIDNPAYTAENEKIQALFNKLKTHFNFHDLYLIAPNGDIVFTINHEKDFASNLITGPYRETQLAWVFERTAKLLESSISQFQSFAPLPKPEKGQADNTHTHSAFMATPILKDEKLLGILAVRLNSSEYYPFLTRYTGVKHTDEVFIGKLETNNAVIISPLRHNPQAAFNLRIPMGSKIAVPLQSALMGKKGSGLSLDYNGVKTLAAWRYIPELKWAIVVKIDASEVFSVAKLLQQKFFLISIGLIILTTLVGLFFAKKLSKPLLVLTQASKKFIKGNYHQKIAIQTSDEIGQLGLYFNQMSTQLRRLMEKNMLANKALNESDNKYRTLFEKSADAMLIIEGDRFIDCNQATVKMLAYDSKKELLATHPSQLSPKTQSDDRNSFEKANEMIAIAFEHGSHRFEWDHKRKNGEVFPVEVLLTAIPFGEKFFLHVVWRDISERKQAEESLLHLQAIIESAKDFIGYADKDGNVKYINRAGRKFLGFSHDEDLSKKRIMDFHSPEANKQLKESSIPTAFRNGSWEGETEFLTQDGRRVPTSQVLVAHKNLHGEISFLSTIARDITKHKQEQSLLKNSEGRIRLLLDSTAEAIYGQDLKGNCTFCNTACLKILGYTNQDELLGNNMHTLIHHTHNDGSPYFVEDCQIHKPFLSSESSHVDSEKLFRKDGSSFPAEYWSYPVIRDGKTIGSVVTFLDITERKKIEQEADDAKLKLIEQQQHQTELTQQELEKIKEQLIRQTRLAAIGQVAASIAHELRNPLGAVRNAAYFMKRRLVSDNPRITQYLDIIDQEIDVSDQIINNLLEMTRAKEPIKQDVDLGDIVREGIKRSNIAKRIQCQLEFEENPFMIYVDHAQLLQVIENLLINAQQSIEGEGIITIQGWHTRDKDFITVQDTGSGIKTEQIEKVFEPLFTTKAKGTGLGLNISRQIIEQHGGALDYLGRDGTGAIFQIQLPRVILQ